MPYYLYPVVILGAIALIFGIVAFLARFRGGELLRPIVTWLAKVPLFRRLMTKASAAALERQNPDLASALKKLERAGAGRDPLQAQRAMSRLTPDERRAYLEAIGEQGVLPQVTNRAERRRIERMQQPPRRKGGNKKSR
jgi:type II secretory pathway component PulF